MIKDEIVALIPAYNPDEKMTTMMDELVKEFDKIVVVNDGCDDSYAAIFEKVSAYDNVTVVTHEVNKGKGRALKTGLEYIMNNCSNAKGVVTADADGQHTTKDILNCCKVFLEENCKSVFGCRDFSSDSDIPPRSRFGNQLTSKLLKFFCDISLSDTQTGLRVLPVNHIKELLEVAGDRYEYEMNMIFALKDYDLLWKEVPIEVIYIDDNASSHFNPIKDSFRIYKVFFKFMLSSFGSSIVDIVLFTIFQIFLKPMFAIWYVTISTALARVCSGIFNFSINRWIFGSKAKITTTGPRYLILWFVQMCLSAGLVTAACYLIPINETIIKIVIDTILFFISYKIQQKWVFVKK